MLGDSIEIVFDRHPPSASRLNIAIATGKPYAATIANRELGLYSLVDDNGRQFNVSTWGRTHTNNGYWHIDDEAYRSLLREEDD
jgi:hypothetical protein